MLKPKLEKILEEYIYYEPIENVDTDDELSKERTMLMIRECSCLILALIKEARCKHGHDMWTHKECFFADIKHRLEIE